jgi:hypothetical protein
LTPAVAIVAIGDGRLALAAISGIALAILVIVRGRLHPFVALLCGARDRDIRCRPRVGVFALSHLM